MQKFNSKEEALASENFDPKNVVITGVPEHHLDAVHAVISLMVGYDAVNKNFRPDFNNYSQRKYNSIHEMGSPSGVGFAFGGFVSWASISHVGARLCSESIEAEKHAEKLFHEEWKKFKVYDRKVE